MARSPLSTTTTQHFGFLFRGGRKGWRDLGKAVSLADDLVEVEAGLLTSLGGIFHVLGREDVGSHPQNAGRLLSDGQMVP